MRAIQLTEFGGPEVLQLVDLDRPEPGDGEVLIKVERVGLNFADTHQRENTYLSKFEVPLVLGGEMAGGRTFDQSLEALAPFGRMITYGLATREPSEVQNGRLMRKSWGVIGFWLMHLLQRPELLREPLADLFERAARGEIRAVVGETYPMSDARRAHEDLQGRRTSGKLLLDPSA